MDTVVRKTFLLVVILAFVMMVVSTPTPWEEEVQALAGGIFNATGAEKHAPGITKYFQATVEFFKGFFIEDSPMVNATEILEPGE